MCVYTHVTITRQWKSTLKIRGSTTDFAGCGIWLFFVVILGMRAKKRSGKWEFDNERERDFLFLLG